MMKIYGLAGFDIWNDVFSVICCTIVYSPLFDCLRCWMESPLCCTVSILE